MILLESNRALIANVKVESGYLFFLLHHDAREDLSYQSLVDTVVISNV